MMSWLRKGHGREPPNLGLTVTFNVDQNIDSCRPISYVQLQIL